jgi:hypothetical protein
MRTGRALVCVLAVVALGTGGCATEGGDDLARAADQAAQQDDGDPGSDVDREHEQAVARSALLTLDDLPPGWEALPADDLEDQDELAADLARCLDVNEEEFHRDNPKATSPTFTSLQGEQVTAEVTVTRSPADAGRAFEILGSDAAPGCYADAIETLIAGNLAASEDVPDDLEIGHPTINRISFDSLGDESMAFRVTIPISVETLDVDVSMVVVLVRVGRVGIETTFLSQLSAFDIDEAERLTELVVDRVADAGVG